MVAFWYNEAAVKAVETPSITRSFTNVRWGHLSDDNEMLYPMHKGQSDVMRSTARFTAAIAGTGGGKTAMGPLWLMREIKRCEIELAEGRRIEPILGLVVAPTYQIMARATAPMLVAMFRGTDYEGIYHESKNRYYLPNGLGVIWLLSADNPGGLEGGQFDFAWLDEGGQLKYDAWIAIQGRTGQKQAPVLITTTPYGMNWLYHHFYKKWRDGDKNYYVRQWASKDNPAYPIEEYNRAKAGMSKQRAAMRYDGKFVRMSGLVYADIDSCYVDNFVPPDGTMYGGIDWGWNNPFCGLSAVLDSDDVLWIYYERYKRFTTVAAHAKAMPKRTNYSADPSRPESIVAFRQAGHTCRKAVNDILVGIDAVSNRIFTGRLKIMRVCKAIAGEAEEYHYPEKDDEAIGEKPKDEFNHAMDALRYLVMGVDKGRLAKSAWEEPTDEEELDEDELEILQRMRKEK